MKDPGAIILLPQKAFDEIKAAEQAKVQELINQSNQERDEQTKALREWLDQSYREQPKRNGANQIEELMASLKSRLKNEENDKEFMRNQLKLQQTALDRMLPGWYGHVLGDESCYNGFHE